MVETNGYPKLIDMGTARRIKDLKGNLMKSFTVLGTP